MRSEENSELDALLEAGLATYASAEPTPGMEERILLAVLAPKSTGFAWWQWSAMAAAFACALALVIFALTHTNTVHAPSIAQITPAQQAAPVTKVAAPAAGTRAESAAIARHNRGRRETAVASGNEAVAQADRTNANGDELFPSPQMLSEEESRIIAMVEQHPAEISQALIEAQKRSAAPVRVAAIHIEPLNTDGQQQEE